jgi:ABC-2 type transport system permease protein
LAQAQAFTRVIPLHSEARLRAVIDDQQVLLALRIPPDFSRRLAAGQPASLQAVLDGRRSNSAQIALGYAQAIIENYLDEHTPPGRASRPGEPPEQGRGAATAVIARDWFNPNLDYRWFILPCLIAIITAISTLVVTSLSVAREREQGTLDQLLVSPLTRGMIMVGKAVPAFIVALFQASIIFLAAVFLYRVPFQGSLLLLLASILCYILALVGVGLLISAVCATQQQAFLGTFSFLMPAILLSGFVTPVDNMPEWFQILSWPNPLRHFIVIVKGIFLKDLPPAAVLDNLWPLLVIGLCTLAAARWMFQRRLA